MSILDRYILRALIFNYVVALTVMIGLYVVMDLFVNLDEFTELRPGTWTLLGHLLDYYAPNLLLYFAQLSGVITTFACLVTLARLRQNNEVTAVLASGVSLYRVSVPVISFAVATSLLLVLDTEALIPTVAHQLARRHDEVGSMRGYPVALMRDQEGVLVSAAEFVPNQRELHRLVAITRHPDGSLWKALEADAATWEPQPGNPHGGRWQLQRGRQRVRTLDKTIVYGPQSSTEFEKRVWFDTSLDPAGIQLRQSEQWVKFLSLAQLHELEASAPPNLPEVQQTRHVRIATPIINLVLLLLGLPFFLSRAPIQLARDATWSLAVGGLCYVTTFISHGIVPDSNSALPAWLPIIFFGPVAMVLMDRVRT